MPRPCSYCTSVPDIVCVLPLPVCPYAKMHTLKPAREGAGRGWRLAAVGVEPPVRRAVWARGAAAPARGRAQRAAGRPQRRTVEHGADQRLRVLVHLLLRGARVEHPVKVEHPALLAVAGGVVDGHLALHAHVGAHGGGVAREAGRAHAAEDADGALEVLDLRAARRGREGGWGVRGRGVEGAGVRLAMLLRPAAGPGSAAQHDSCSSRPPTPTTHTHTPRQPPCRPAALRRTWLYSSLFCALTSS